MSSLDNQEQNVCSSAGRAPPRHDPPGLFARYRRRLLWLIAITFLLAIQWPLLKEMAYGVLKIPAPPDGIAWRTDYTVAQAEAKKAGKPVLLDFTASWCPPCQVMKREVWPDEDVRRLVDRSFIPVLMDVDDIDGGRTAQHYAVSRIPTILIVDGDGQVLHGGEFMSRSEMVKFLRKAAAG
jgi:thiol:disulfide interchange protein